MNPDSFKRHESDSPSAPSTRTFAVPRAIREDLAFALETGDGDVLAAACLRHGIEVDAFQTREVPAEDRAPEFDNMPDFLCVSMSFGLKAPELLLALPASIGKAVGLEIAFRIAANGRGYADHSAVCFEMRDGRELLLFGGWDKSVDEADCFIFGHRYDLPMARMISTAIN